MNFLKWQKNAPGIKFQTYIGLEEKGKFDINWQWETFEYKWKMFLWRRKIKTE